MKRERFRPVPFYVSSRQVREMTPGVYVANSQPGGWYFFNDYTRKTLDGPWPTEQEAQQMIDRKWKTRKAKAK